MRWIWLYVIFIYLFSSCINQLNDSNTESVDVCVYGGTASGVIAAYSAKKMGKSVILIEPGKYLGGMTTGGLGYTDIGNKYAITGLSKLFYRRIGEHYNKFEQWSFPPSVATKEIQRFVDDAQLDVRFYRRIVDARVEGRKIVNISLEDALNPESKNLCIKAKQFIDCSYEGDLMACSGVSYFLGREDNALFDETLNGVQLRQYHQFPDSIDPYIIKGDSLSGLCWGINPVTLEKQGSGDKCVQAYNYRLCLTNKSENLRPFEKPVNYDSTKYELLARTIEKQLLPLTSYLLINWEMPEGKYDVNNNGPFSTDMIGMNYNYPESNYIQRDEIARQHKDYIQGLLYFLSSSNRIPLSLRKEVRKWGWAKDEFIENDNFPTQLYVRESRRLRGEYVMSQKNCQGVESVGDAVAMAAYGMDSHNCQRIVVNGMVKNEGDVQFHGFDPYPISYKSLVPEKKECTNLLVPVCLSATHIAYGSIRMEPVFMSLGQAAGIASAMAIDQQLPVQDVDITKLRRILNQNPYLDGSIPEILVDDTDIDKVKQSSFWAKRIAGNYKTSYVSPWMYEENAFFSFLPIIKNTASYKIYFYCTVLSDGELPDLMALDINTGTEEKRVFITPKKYKGDWVCLGEFLFEEGAEASVTVKQKESVGPLFADAIILVANQK